MVITLQLDVNENLTDHEANQFVVDALNNISDGDNPIAVNKAYYNIQPNISIDDLLGL